MTNRLMISVAAAALIAGTGFANAQGAAREPSAAPETQKSAPAPARGSSATTPMNRESTHPSAPGSEMKGAQADQKPAAKGNERAEDNMQGRKSKETTSEMNDNSKGKDAKDMKADGAERKGNMNAETKGGEKEQTTGQAASGGKMTSEQRTRVSTVIRDQHVTSITNVNFSISVGTRVPRDVEFHPLPAEIVTIYPDWRGYEFILVRDQILVIDPATFAIVAVLDA
jgi:hypothetical protein